MSVCAFDGAPYHVPATEAVRQAFDPQRGLEYAGRGPAPQGLVPTAYDGFRRLPVGRTVGALQAGAAREHAPHRLPLCPPTSLRRFARGGPSDGCLTALPPPSRRSRRRGPATSPWPAVEALARRGRAATRLGLTPAETFTRSRTPAPRRPLAPRRRRAMRWAAPAGAVAVLLPTLGDVRRVPRATMIARDWRRWAVATHDRDEQTLQPIAPLHSHTPAGIRQERGAILSGGGLARTRTARAVPAEAIETAQSPVRPQLKNARMSFARAAALWTPAHPEKARVILQALLNAMRQGQDDQPPSQRLSRPRVHHQPANKWPADRQRKWKEVA